MNTIEIPSLNTPPNGPETIERLTGFPPLPKGLRHFHDWGAVCLTGNMRVLDLPDVHIPYHDEQALEIALHHGAHFDPTHIIISGDFADFFSVSFWEKDPRKRDLKQELDMCCQALAHIRARFPNAQIIYKKGNHEERWDRYLAVKAPELYNLPQVQLTNILKLDEIGATLVDDCRPIKLGKYLYVVHGHEFKWGITNPVNPARGYYMRSKACTVGHHLHQSSFHSEPSLDGTNVSCWSTGCLCDLHPDYAPVNKWNHGFATFEVDEAGKFHVRNYRIIDGVVYE